MGEAATPTLKSRLMGVLRSLPAPVLRARAEEVLRVDKRDRLAATTCPILFLYGTSDRLIRRQQVADVLASRPDCQLRQLGAPHMLLATHAEAAALAIQEFCGLLER